MGGFHDVAGARLAQQGRRLTGARRELLDAIAVAGRPPTAAQVATATGLPTSSVYRNLGILVKANVLALIPCFDRHDRYEIEATLEDEHRHHLVCVRCGAIDDYVAPATLESLVAELTPDVARERGFELRGHTLDLIGVCRLCSDGELVDAG